MDVPPSHAGKPVASLSQTLLARKGGARPAMRPQLEPLPGPSALEDLGWNDLGEGPPPARGHVVRFPSEVLAHSRAAAAEAARPRRRRPRGSALEHGRKAAFTLRLDAERHLRLRLACTLDARSAQSLVTDALDRLLAEMPEVEGLAEQVSHRSAKRRQS